MKDNNVKKLGVIVIVLLFTAYIVSLIAMCLLTDFPLLGIIGYAAIMLLILAGLTYEGWLRIREIDEGLEDDVDNY